MHTNSPGSAGPVVERVYRGATERVPALPQGFDSRCCYLVADYASRRLFTWIGVRSSASDRNLSEQLGRAVVEEGGFYGWALPPVVRESTVLRSSAEEVVAFRRLLGLAASEPPAARATSALVAPPLRVLPPVAPSSSRLYSVSFPSDGEPILTQIASVEENSAPSKDTNLLLASTLLEGNCGVMLLETLCEAFIFCRRFSSTEERRAAERWAEGQRAKHGPAVAYVLSPKSSQAQLGQGGQSVAVPPYTFITVVEEGYEPLLFRRRFSGWEAAARAAAALAHGAAPTHRRVPSPMASNKRPRTQSSGPSDDESSLALSSPSHLSHSERPSPLDRKCSYRREPSKMSFGGQGEHLRVHAGGESGTGGSAARGQPSNTSWQPATSPPPLPPHAAPEPLLFEHEETACSAVEKAAAGAAVPTTVASTPAQPPKVPMLVPLSRAGLAAEVCRSMGNTTGTAAMVVLGIGDPSNLALTMAAAFRPGVLRQWRVRLGGVPRSGEPPPEDQRYHPLPPGGSSLAKLRLTVVPPEQTGALTSGDAFVIVSHRIAAAGKVKEDAGPTEVRVETILYLWVGREYPWPRRLIALMQDDTTDRLLAQALEVTDDDIRTQLGDRAVSDIAVQTTTKVICEEGREPPFLLGLFTSKGRAGVLLSGSYSRWRSSASPSNTRIFEVLRVPPFPWRGPHAYAASEISAAAVARGLLRGTTYLVMCGADASALVFRELYIWHGDRADPDAGMEAFVAELVRDPSRLFLPSQRQLPLPPDELVRGFVHHFRPGDAVPDAFWAALGAAVPEVAAAKRSRPIRLWRVSHAAACAWEGGPAHGVSALTTELARWPSFVREVGALCVFQRRDLAANASYVLDGGGDEVFVWHGSQSSLGERTTAVRVAKIYATLAVRGKAAPTLLQLLQAEQGREPIAFTCCFRGWDVDRSGRAGADPSVDSQPPMAIDPYTLSPEDEDDVECLRRKLLLRDLETTEGAPFTQSQAPSPTPPHFPIQQSQLAPAASAAAMLVGASAAATGVVRQQHMLLRSNTAHAHGATAQRSANFSPLGALYPSDEDSSAKDDEKTGTAAAALLSLQADGRLSSFPSSFAAKGGHSWTLRRIGSSLRPGLAGKGTDGSGGSSGSGSANAASRGGVSLAGPWSTLTSQPRGVCDSGSLSGRGSETGSSSHHCGEHAAGSADTASGTALDATGRPSALHGMSGLLRRLGSVDRLRRGMSGRAGVPLAAKSSAGSLAEPKRQLGEVAAAACAAAATAAAAAAKVVPGEATGLGTAAAPCAPSLRATVVYLANGSECASETDDVLYMVIVQVFRGHSADADASSTVRKWSLQRSLMDFRGLFLLINEDCHGMSHKFPGRARGSSAVGASASAPASGGAAATIKAAHIETVKSVNLWLRELLQERCSKMSARGRYRLGCFLGAPLPEDGTQLAAARQREAEAIAAATLAGGCDAIREATERGVPYYHALPQRGLFLALRHELDKLAHEVCREQAILISEFHKNDGEGTAAKAEEARARAAAEEEKVLMDELWEKRRERRQRMREVLQAKVVGGREAAYDDSTVEGVLREVDGNVNPLWEGSGSLRRRHGGPPRGKEEERTRSSEARQALERKDGFGLLGRLSSMVFGKNDLGMSEPINSREVSALANYFGEGEIRQLSAYRVAINEIDRDFMERTQRHQAYLRAAAQYQHARDASELRKKSLALAHAQLLLQREKCIDAYLSHVAEREQRNGDLFLL